MKKIFLFSCLFFVQFSMMAQNEGRVGFFSGVSKTVLANTDDAKFGDFLPTFKPGFGLDAAYHFTLGKHFPMGFSVEFFNQKMGQNYHGFYADSTSYYAYSRLNYLKAGLAMHFGTNPRRAFALTLSFGANMGFLTNYQDRYELIRYNNDRYILDIKNTDVTLDDTAKIKGTLTSPMYNKTDLCVFGKLGFDVLLSSQWVLSVYGRLDYGLSPVENTSKMNINFNTQPASSMPYKPFNTKVKYHGPTNDLVTHSTTTNQAMGVYLALHYRIFNKEKSEFYYKENSRYNN
ncbi:MAG TPA: hypothetical protein PLP34_10585 [Chitinophagaceae bacterium]|nr:hypothetical protein [Chitinophagaceae bacterium]HNF72855.1 hypothetical protein [Chitinophagaceae bacterium]